MLSEIRIFYTWITILNINENNIPRIFTNGETKIRLRIERNNFRLNYYTYHTICHINIKLI